MICQWDWAQLSILRYPLFSLPWLIFLTLSFQLPRITIQTLCISYLLLYNKLSPNSAAWDKNEHLLSLVVSTGKEIRESSTLWFWPRASHEVAVKWRHDWSWRVHFQGGSLRSLASCYWLLAGGLTTWTSLQCCLRVLTTWQMTALPGNDPKESKGVVTTSFMT